MTAPVIRPDGFRGVFRQDAAARGVYAEAAGIARIIPTAVAVPADADDVVALVRWAAATGTPLIPRGSGSSMAGGAIGAGVIVDLSRLDTIGPVQGASHRATQGASHGATQGASHGATQGASHGATQGASHGATQGASHGATQGASHGATQGASHGATQGASHGATITVGPGAIAAQVDRAAATAGLRFPVDPSSAEFCTVGGMAATNAAGAHTLRFGSMRRWVTALDCVFADGTRRIVRRGTPIDRESKFTSFRHAGVRKDSSGYDTAGDLIDLLVGSEGTLALFVGLELALTPKPAATASLLAAFPSLDAAVAGTHAARDIAVACELLDKTFLNVAESGGTSKRLPTGTEAVLLIELEGDTPATVAATARTLGAAIEQAGATLVDLALDADAEHTLWSLRHAASPILSRLDPSLKSMQFIEDGAVPPDRLAEYVRGVRAALARHEIRGVIFGHAGDAHIHVNPLIDVRQPDWRRRLDAVLTNVTALTASLGGTLTGEHGDGRLRTPLLADVWPAAARDQFARIKHAFDPRGILNPGVKVPLPGQHAVTDVKYDPSLPPLPPTAAAALRRVERDRAYARSRLDLLDEP